MYVLSIFLPRSTAAEYSASKLQDPKRPWCGGRLLDEKNQEIIDEPFATAKSEGFPAGWTAKHFKASTTGGGDIIFGVRADLNLLQRMGQIISLGSKRVIRLSLMKCAMLFTINFCQAGRLSKR